MLCALQTDKNQECSKRVYTMGWKDHNLQSLLNDPCFEYFEAVGLISDSLDSPSISPEAPRSPTYMLFWNDKFQLQYWDDNTTFFCWAVPRRLI